MINYYLYWQIAKQLTSKVVVDGYKPNMGINLNCVRVMGVKTKPQSVKVNGNNVVFSYDENSEVGYYVY